MLYVFGIWTVYSYVIKTIYFTSKIFTHVSNQYSLYNVDSTESHGRTFTERSADGRMFGGE